MKRYERLRDKAFKQIWKDVEMYKGYFNTICLSTDLYILLLGRISKKLKPNDAMYELYGYPIETYYEPGDVLEYKLIRKTEVSKVKICEDEDDESAEEE